MKVVFLDIDGVLNTEKHYMAQVKANNNQNDASFQFNFDPEAMQYLKEIIDKTNAKIVITSTWRIGRDVSEKSLLSRYWNAILQNFYKYGYLYEEILGTTPFLQNNGKEEVLRGQEIEEFLKDNPNIINFVIIDDDSDMGKYTETNLAQCDPYYGIDNIVKELAISILNTGEMIYV